MAATSSPQYVMIIGAMKCGTSSLYQCLIQYPQICPCRVKEPEFFSANQGHGCGVSRYESLWDFQEDVHTYCLEGSTGYTKFPEEPSVPENIYAYGLEPRFIYVVRDPIERIVSDYNYMWQHPYLEAGRLMNKERICRSMYYLQLERYLEYFPDKEQYLVLQLEDLRSNSEEIMQEVFRFLNLPPFEEIEFGVYNKTAEVSTVEQWFRTPGLYNLRQLVPASLRTSLRRILRRWTGSARRELTVSERQLLGEQLAPDAQKLFKEFGVGKDWDLIEAHVS